MHYGRPSCKYAPVQGFTGVDKRTGCDKINIENKFAIPWSGSNQRTRQMSQGVGDRCGEQGSGAEEKA